MLTLTIPVLTKGGDYWDSTRNIFVGFEDRKFSFEHSLASVAEWESTHHKAFLSSKLTAEDTLDYARCMCLDKDVTTDDLEYISQDALEKLNSYIEDPNTATTVHSLEDETKNPRGGKKEIITAELIYYWMFSLNIPLECEHWHLNRLLMLINVFNAKNAPQKKIPRRELAARNRSLNAKRRAQLKTKG